MLLCLVILTGVLLLAQIIQRGSTAHEHGELIQYKLGDVYFP